MSCTALILSHSPFATIFFLNFVMHAISSVRQVGDKGNLRSFDRVSVAQAKPFKHGPSELMVHSGGRKWIAGEKAECVDSLNHEDTHESSCASDFACSDMRHSRYLRYCSLLISLNHSLQKSDDYCYFGC